MAALNTPRQTRDPYLAMLHVGAIASAVMSGTFALLAFVFGSPLEFGIALALCATWWIVDDFVTSMLKREHVRLNHGYRSRTRHLTARTSG